VIPSAHDRDNQAGPAAPAAVTRLEGGLYQRETRLLQSQVQLVAQHGQTLRAAKAAFDSGKQSACSDCERTKKAIEEEFQRARAEAQRQKATVLQTLTARLETEKSAIERQCQEALDRLGEEVAAAEKRAQKAYDEARWLARTVYEAKRRRLSQRAHQVQKQLRARLNQAMNIEQSAVACLARFGQTAPAVPPPFESPEVSVAANQNERLPESLAAAEARLQALQTLRLPRFLRDAGPLWIFLALATVFTPTLGWLASWRPLGWIAPAAILTAALSLILTLWLRAVAKQRVCELYRELIEQVRIAQRLAERSLAESLAQFKRQRAEIRTQRSAEVSRAAAEYEPVIAQCRLRRDVDMPRLIADADARLSALEHRVEEDGRDAEKRYGQALADARQKYEQCRDAAQSSFVARLKEYQARFDAVRAQCLAEWQTGLAAIRREVANVNRETDIICPPWSALIDVNDFPWATTPEAIRFGRLQLDLPGTFDEAADSPTATPPGELNLPALLRFPEDVQVYIQAQDGSRHKAVELLQVLMLRMLVALPPGKVRFTIIDPVGLGQNFAGFMHLADHDESLVGHRIWTEPSQIEQRLADLTEHMETVIQKYLRDEFPTLDAYNVQAGEIAEPYRVVVVAGFPAGFSEAAARRLLSIAESGPRCGVHLLVSVDSKLPPVPGVGSSALRRQATLFSATTAGIVWHDRHFKHLPLAIDPLPRADQLKKLLHRVGAAAVSARRVEVPFEAIAPPAEAYWTADSRHGIDVPLGRVGASRLQHLRLGQGTSQHVLIAGKTGSGKSTLLHALVTNVALRYSPDQVEFYLIDFKKGVEFKTYVTHRLPHARVVAIESEREFGLSVMQRLDAEMQLRGNRFRAAGVHDIAGFRDLNHTLPRILLIIDEFQEFFIEDDKLAQEAALLLDRLIRQGRAFGIHVHLGSQTLGGAYTLARSTLGQVAVRIALQCSEADAHLILSEDNQAARLLSRPGEAIYNDANGLIEGNHPFQVVWLPDDRRETYLEQIARLAAQRLPVPSRDTIVFEGMRPADIEKDHSVAALFAAPPCVADEPRIWLGEPVSLGDATTTTLPRRGGANFLCLGQNEDAAAGILGAALLSLASQLPRAQAHAPTAFPAIFMLEGTSPKGPLARALDHFTQILAERIQRVREQDVAALMNRLSGELNRRQASQDEAPPTFLFVYDLARVRELRQQEETFSFTRSNETSQPRPDRLFAELLREGPPRGMHVLVWCDNLTNFNRTLERHSLKEFQSRVFLQMGAADSSLLIDTQAASQLGPYRALYQHEAEGRLEKFRPFALPSDAWLAAAMGRMASRHQRARNARAADDPSENRLVV
jgi:energy-coupling factor transporter ATP-binding protein EcfA2